MSALVENLLARASALAGEVPKQRKSGTAKINRVATQRLFAPFERARNEAYVLRNIGEQLPPMTKLGGPARFVARAAGKGILRIAQLITRDQRQFNAAIVRTVDALRAVVATQEHQLREVAPAHDESLAERVAALEEQVAKLKLS